MIHAALGQVRGLKGLANAYRRVRSRLLGGGLVLLYHRVTDRPADPFALHVTPQRFAEQLDVLRRTTTPLGLGEMLALVRAGDLPARAVAVTFDDGYADNLHQAAPALERYGVPATVFVATGPLDGVRSFWWDELDRLVLSPARLPPALQLAAGGGTLRWGTGGREATARDRRRLLRLLHRRLRPATDEERRNVLEQLVRWAGAAPPPSGAEDRPLTAQEVARLDSSPLVRVGSHSVSHGVLGKIPPERQAAELRDSKRRLEEILGRPVDGFSYPYGLPGDYTARTVALTREAGYAYACTALADLLRAGGDPYRIPRVWARDEEGDAFARRLAAWLPAKPR
ncbi:MAG: polysaccharide deacetylase family protein [Candidatus Krumholzibacteriia bacterium]